LAESDGDAILDAGSGRRTGALAATRTMAHTSAVGGLVAGASMLAPYREFGCWEAATGRLVWSRGTPSPDPPIAV
jgi:hypothetical protein